MRIRQLILGLSLGLLVTGCRSLEPERATFESHLIQDSPMHTPIPQPTATSYASPTRTATSTSAPLSLPTPTMLPTVTSTPYITPVSLPAPAMGSWSEDGGDLLPAPLYFLSGQLSSWQIWRIEVDGETLTQITAAGTHISAFDISPVTGQIAYIADEGLAISDAFGNEARIIDTSEMSYSNTLREAATSLAWSPDGTRLALAGQDGVWLYTLSNGELTQLLAIPSDTFTIWLESPHAWSPDGNLLLVGRMYANSDYGEAAYVMVDDGTMTMMSISVCCDFTWSPDSQLVYASMEVSTALCPSPGLQRWSLADGETATLVSSGPIPGERVAGHFIHTAQEGSDGFLYYLYGFSEVPSDSLQYGALAMYRSAGDGITDRVLLRSDTYAEILEVLWADDMSLAVIVDGSATDSPRTGAVTLLTVDNKPPVVLAPEGFRPRWGKQTE